MQADADDASLAAFRDRFAGPRKTVTVVGPQAYEELQSLVSRFDVDLEHEHLDVPESKGYLTVTQDDQFLGAVPAAAFDELLDPGRATPWDAAARRSAFRELTSILAGTGFRTTDRRHLLAVTRAFEDRAWRAGRGTLHVGFQSLSTFRTQLPVYERLTERDGLDVFVYGHPDWESPDPSDALHAPDALDRSDRSDALLAPDALDRSDRSDATGTVGVTLRTAPGGELGSFWIVAFDGGGDDELACALLAEERRPDEFDGAWTDDPGLVRELVAYLDARYGG